MEDYNDESIRILENAIKEHEFGQGQVHELLGESRDAMKLTVDQRRELMDQIMNAAWMIAKEAAPYDGNILDDTDEADEVIEKRLQIVVQKMLELKKHYGFPNAKYDKETKRAYIEYASGHREYFDI